ncbi:histone-arginine methyltransferase-like [Raphidocelis subcapitata]|uniref:type I protein arginine methyltransferase n=1 Tax=Raphidocelis subcapitata TaxID=307507 RepID=A0A2V0NP95_9CHLO|nr:histone-arginine methyltransferase-like [Raphidocelis subcapitata]|eukprot:GBF88352.1 histone-arginine methyltransferase-like [Raphidocelis subcapitata]
MRPVAVTASALGPGQAWDDRGTSLTAVVAAAASGGAPALVLQRKGGGGGGGGEAPGTVAIPLEPAAAWRAGPQLLLVKAPPGAAAWLLRGGGGASENGAPAPPAAQPPLLALACGSAADADALAAACDAAAAAAASGQRSAKGGSSGGSGGDGSGSGSAGDGGGGGGGGGGGNVFDAKIDKTSSDMYFHYYGMLQHQQNMLQPMGTLLVNERMLETYIYARDKFLKPGGRMFPQIGRIHAAAFSDALLYGEVAGKAGFWQQPAFYGVDVTGLFEAAAEGYFAQVVVDAFDPSVLVSGCATRVFDFATIKESDLTVIDLPLELTVASPATVHGVATWFDVLFNGSAVQRWLSTAPGLPTTHWFQLRCVLAQPLAVLAPNTVLRGSMRLTAHERQSYTVEITLTAPPLAPGGPPQKSSGRYDLKEPFYRQLTNWYYQQQQASPLDAVAVQAAAAAVAAAAAAAPPPPPSQQQQQVGYAQQQGGYAYPAYQQHHQQPQQAFAAQWPQQQYH